MPASSTDQRTICKILLSKTDAKVQMRRPQTAHVQETLVWRCCLHFLILNTCHLQRLPNRVNQLWSIIIEMRLWLQSTPTYLSWILRIAKTIRYFLPSWHTCDNSTLFWAPLRWFQAKPKQSLFFFIYANKMKRNQSYLQENNHHQLIRLTLFRSLSMSNLPQDVFKKLWTKH